MTDVDITLTGWSDDDQAMMDAALAEARRAVAASEVPVGAVVTRSGTILGRGHNETVSANDPSALDMISRATQLNSTSIMIGECVTCARSLLRSLE